MHEARCTDQIHEALAGKGLVPGTHLTDSAYIDAGHLAEAQDEHGIQLVGPTRKDPSWQAKLNRQEGQPAAYTKDQFQIDWTEEEAICPEGKRSASWGEYASKARGDYVSVRFAKEDCSLCPARALCTRGERRSLLLHPERERRSLLLHPEREHRALRETRHLMQTEEGKRLYAKRAGVEGTVSQGVRRCGLRRTRYRGLAKTHLGHLATAAALNLSRVAAWLGGQEPARRTRTSRFARLMAPAGAT